MPDPRSYSYSQQYYGFQPVANIPMGNNHSSILGINIPRETFSFGEKQKPGSGSKPSSTPSQQKK